MFLLAALALCGGVSAGIPATPAAAQGTVLVPQALVRQSGVVTGSVGALATYDQSGSTVSAVGVVSLGPGPHRTYRSYHLPPTIAEADVWGITVRTHVNAPTKRQQAITWFLRNFTTNRWTKLDTNIEIDPAEAGTWYDLDLYALGTLTDYISPTGELQVRTTATNRPTVTHLDTEWIEIDHGARPTTPGWHPPLNTRWQYQLQPPVVVDVTGTAWDDGAIVVPEAFDIDLYEADGLTPAAATVAAIHGRGARAICYVSAGSYEEWRPDAALFPAVVLGRGNGWPGERWLDVRRHDLLLPIMAARVAKCVAAGFDSVEFDNVDGVSNRTGFTMSQADQVEYNRALADLAHSFGISVGLKNDLAQLTPLFAWFDYAINEQCSEYAECGLYDPWTDAGKHVVQVEYTAALGAFCPDAIAHGRSGIKKSLDLAALPYTPCT